MSVNQWTIKPGFSLIEVVIVVAIIAIITTIAMPRFADASAGRRLQAAINTINDDIENAQLRARATSKTHLIKFYPAENQYVIVEGDEIKRESVILIRDFDDAPYQLNLNRTDLGGNEVLVVTPYGILSPSCRIQFIEEGISKEVDFEGIDAADVGVVPTLTLTLDEILSLKPVLDLLGGL